MRDYGVEVYGRGLVFHTDGRRRRKVLPGWTEIESRKGASGPRGPIKSFSESSRRMLDFISANAAMAFQAMLTLTYHAKAATWEGDDARNARIVERSKRDLNRFLTRLRGTLGAYLWVQEFQTRGVVHYHVLCEREPDPARVRLVWCRATDELDDAAACEHSTKVDPLRDQDGARFYLGSYLGKGRQKSLPPGVVAAGRWWGRSRSLVLDRRDEIVAGESGEPNAIRVGVRIVRAVRRYVSKAIHRKVRGGRFVFRDGRIPAAVQGLLPRLREFYGTPVRPSELFASFGWERLGEGGGR